MTCRVCHRVLKKLSSIAKGIGPICEAKEKAQLDLFDDEEGHVCLGEFKGDVILSRDVMGRPVTNIHQVTKRHSPSGFEWGYGGSGPADLALNILLLFTDKETADRLHQDFKWSYIAKLPPMGGTIKGEEIKAFIKEREVINA